MRCTATTRFGQRCTLGATGPVPLCGQHWWDPERNLLADAQAERDRAEGRAWARLLRAEDGGS